MKIYMVGGAVRDTLLGLPVGDHDWVVVGASPQQMLDQGFTPVGKDFPVFLHPRTHEEYALARTERKTAPGYKGFAIHAAPDVTLEQDLERRDLTINALAVDTCFIDAEGHFDAAGAEIVDPFGGRQDLNDRVLRHVSDAFREDPVRILRVARFAARFADFHVAPETGTLMRDMVAHGEARALVAERVWQELSRGLMEQRPSRMLQVLAECGALAQLVPELASSGAGAVLPAATLPGVLDEAARSDAPLVVRFACLALALPDQAARDAVCQRLRVPNDCRDLALLAAREHDALLLGAGLDAEGLVQLLERCDALRKPARFHDLLQVSALAQPATDSGTQPGAGARSRLAAALAAAQAVPTADIARTEAAAGRAGTQVGEAIRAARIAAVQAGGG